MKSEFDQYAQTYDLELDSALSSFIDVPNEYFSEFKVKELFSFCKARGITPRKIFNFGCGTGKSEEFLIKYFPDSKIYAFDISQASIVLAKKRLLNNVYFFTLKPKSKLKSDFFDMIFISNVFHHIEHKAHHLILSDLFKHLKVNGSLLLFEHNPLNPLTLKVVKECEFDKDAKLLHFWYTKQLMKASGFSSIKIRFIFFIPPMLKKLLFLEKYLKWLPFGAQYYISAKKVLPDD